MPVKIRLQRRGRKKRPFYHIVIADARAPRDGRFIEKIGTYNPLTKPATIDIDRDKAYDWLMKGAQPTDTVRAILRFKGVLVKKHLMRGVAKGALTEEQATEKWNKWLEEKEAKILARKEKEKKTKAEEVARIAGVGMDVKKKEEEKKPAAPEAVAQPETEAPPAEDVATTEAPATEEAPTTEEVKEETAAAEEPAQEETPAEEPVAEATTETEETTASEETPAATEEEPAEQKEEEEGKEEKSE